MHFELHSALCSGLGLKEMSVSFTDNILTENYQFLFHFLLIFQIIAHHVKFFFSIVQKWRMCDYTDMTPFL